VSCRRARNDFFTGHIQNHAKIVCFASCRGSIDLTSNHGGPQVRFYAFETPPESSFDPIIEAQPDGPELGPLNGMYHGYWHGIVWAGHDDFAEIKIDACIANAQAHWNAMIESLEIIAREERLGVIKNTRGQARQPVAFGGIKLRHEKIFIRPDPQSRRIEGDAKSITFHGGNGGVAHTVGAQRRLNEQEWNSGRSRPLCQGRGRKAQRQHH